MFTLTDIQSIAVQIERNGEAAYRQAGEKTPHADLSRTLLWMADEELRHIRWFESLETDRGDNPVDQEVEQMGRALLQEMMNQQTFSLDRDQLGDVENVQALLSQSLSFEQDTILFYEMLAAFIDNPDIRGQLDVIIEEERKHVVQIERMQRGEARLKQ